MSAITPPKPVSPLLAQHSDEMQIDPKIVIHPPQSSIGVLPPGIPVAQNEYPGLQMLLIHSPGAPIHPIPTQWPNFKLEPIPTQWPNFKLEGISTQKP